MYIDEENLIEKFRLFNIISEDIYMGSAVHYITVAI